MTDSNAGTFPVFDPAMVVDVDLRPGFTGEQEVSDRIVAAALGLPGGRVLHIRTATPPPRLPGGLEARGFVDYCLAFARDDWSTWLWRRSSPPPTPPGDRPMPEDRP